MKDVSWVLGINIVIGVPGVVPIWLLWYFLANWPLAAMGWTQGEPTENDGMLPWFMLAGPVLLVFSVFWWIVNRQLRRVVMPGSPRYWLTSVAGVFLPTFVLILVL